MVANQRSALPLSFTLSFNINNGIGLRIRNHRSMIFATVTHIAIIFKFISPLKFHFFIQNDAEPSAEEVEAQLQHDIKDDAPREIKDVEPDEESTEIEHQQLQAVSFIKIIFIISHQKYLMGNNDL